MNNRIKILPPDIYNKIAAGEVVERPASALKEVVENSIDAGARRIVIEVANGGFDLIAVTDNGCGIYEEDLAATFVKHATSKLEYAEDLDLIQTLGFRGEALSSIAAVSRVTLTTRQAQADTAVRVCVEDGQIVSREYVSANIGTKIEIRDLFYNTPARKKFMKNESREAADLTKYVAKLVLTNPNLEMTYICDGKIVYQTHGKGLSEAIFTVYGADCVKNCLPVSFENEYMRIVGYIGSPQFTKANTTYQTLSVNGRCISDKGIQSAVTQAYKPYLMTRQYPFFVLDLSIPCDMVDVNIHPRKTEVRFQNAQHVCGKFFRAVEAVLKEYSKQRVNEILSVQDDGDTFIEPIRPMFRDDDFDKTGLLKNITEMTADQVEDVLKIEQQTRAQNKQTLEELADELERTLTVQSARRAIGLEDENGIQQPVAALEIENLQPPEAVKKQDELGEALMSRARILGSAFKTYLIVEIDEKVVFIDQHAAHERLLFDKFMESKSTSMQQLLFPYVFHVTDEEADFIEQNIPNILSAGIEVEPFGKNTFRICAVSSLLADTQMDDFVKYLLSSVEEFKVDDRTLIVEKIAKKACKAAVKAGYVMSEFEIRYILKAIYENKVLQCPHGRPVTVVFTKSQLEKMFKRIV